MRSEKGTLKSHAGDVKSSGNGAWLPLKDNPQEHPRTLQRLNCIRDTPLCASTVADLRMDPVVHLCFMAVWLRP